MGCLDGEALTAMSVLLKQGHSQSAVARLLGMTEGAVRNHRRRRAEGAVDGRSRQIGKAAEYAEAIAHWRSSRGDGAINIAALHEWLTREHGDTGSLKSVQRYWSRTFSAPAIRVRRRVETPPGAQAQVDWAEFPGMVLGEEAVDLSALVMTLSWSRKRAIVWSRSKDALAWQSCHLACFQRLGGVAAVMRIDNVKTALSKGAGAWGEINPTYRRFASQMHFHVDACQVRQPRAKGKVERSVRDCREYLDPYSGVSGNLADLQAWTDERMTERSGQLRCPATGTKVMQAWGHAGLGAGTFPADPAPRDAARAVRRCCASPGGDDCMASFEGCQYSVPFRFIRQDVEVRGVSGRVLFLKNCEVVADHPRGTEALVVIDPAHFEGPSRPRVIAPLPLGRMGRKLQEIASAGVQHRSLDLYARLAEVAR